MDCSPASSHTHTHTHTRKQKCFFVFFLVWVATRRYAKLFVVSNWWHLLQLGRQIYQLTQTHTHSLSHTHTHTHTHIHTKLCLFKLVSEIRQRGETVAKRPGLLASRRSTSLVGLYCHFANLSARSALSYCRERSSFLSAFNSGGWAGAQINKVYWSHRSWKENTGVRWPSEASLMIALHPGE